MEKTELLHAHNFENTVITKLCCNAFEGRSERYCTMTIQGNFGDEEKEYRHYNLYFIRSQDLLPTEELQTLTNPVLRKINVVKTDQTYHAKLEISSDSQTISLDFHCSFDVGRSHYRGFDYTNIYETKEFDAWADHFRYAESPEYFQNESTISLPDGYSLLCKEYLHQTEHTVRACFSRYTLQKGGKCLYEFTSIEGHHNPFQEWIHHRNGHRYYPFHISLYGISYLDVDTLEVFHYIPRGYDNDYGAPNGESFIITDIHYDPQSDLIAYGGCYWAGTSDVMVGIFRDPMQFDPHLCSVHEILDPEYEELDDVDFDKWDDGLLVKADGKCTGKISVQTLQNAMKTQAEQKERKS